MMVIGRAKDLGSCEVMNYGATKPCGSWVDTLVIFLLHHLNPN